jgi:hypothetical protein
MAKTVSRSGDNGNSTPVNVPIEEGVYVEHKADPVDVSASRSKTSISTKGLESINTGSWIENLMASATNFSSEKGSFKLKANGLHGSVQTLAEELRRDPFVLRAVQRGRIRFLTDEEAVTRINELVEEEHEHEDHYSHLMESLGSNASENNGMYKVDLPDEAEQKGSPMTPEQIWKGSNKPTNLK